MNNSNKQHINYCVLLTTPFSFLTLCCNMTSYCDNLTMITNSKRTMLEKKNNFVFNNANDR